MQAQEDDYAGKLPVRLVDTDYVGHDHIPAAFDTTASVYTWILAGAYNPDWKRDVDLTDRPIVVDKSPGSATTQRFAIGKVVDFKYVKRSLLIRVVLFDCEETRNIYGKHTSLGIKYALLVYPKAEFIEMILSMDNFAKPHDRLTKQGEVHIAYMEQNPPPEEYDDKSMRHLKTFYRRWGRMTLPTTPFNP